MNKLSFLVKPPKIKAVLTHGKTEGIIRILDVGCGNGSPSVFKNWYPKAIYDGLDIEEYNLSEKDKSLINRFYLVAPGQSYLGIVDEKYDLIVMNHVVEHMKDAHDRIVELCSFLNPGGIIYLAFPSLETLSFPSAIGTLNFCDDPTHVYMPCVREITNVLLKNNIKVVYAGRKRDWLRSIIGIPIFCINIFKKLISKKSSAYGLWSLYKFEASVIGFRK